MPRIKYPAKVDITWRYVASSNLKRVGWCKYGGLIEFQSSSIYFYPGVSRQRMVALAYAHRLTKFESCGKYVNKRLRKMFKGWRVV